MLGDRGLQFAVAGQMTEQGFQGLPEIVVWLMSRDPDGAQEIRLGDDADQGRPASSTTCRPLIRSLIIRCAASVSGVRGCTVRTG